MRQQARVDFHESPSAPNTLWFGSDYAEDSVVLRKHPDGVLEVTYYPHNDPQRRRLHLFVPLSVLSEWADKPFWADPSFEPGNRSKPA